MPVNDAPIMDEIRKRGEAGVQVSRALVPEMIPTQGLLGLAAHELTKSREIPVSGTVVTRYEWISR